MKFHATLLQEGKSATGIPVPAEVVEAFGKKRFPVQVTINGHTYRSTVAPMGGRHMIPVSAENRAAAGIAAGDDIEVDIEPDTEVRQVEVPGDLATALAGVPEAQQFFASLSYSHQRAYVLWVESAKKAETRERRVGEAVTMLGERRTRS